MRVLAVTHSDTDPSQIFGQVVRERGHELHEGAFATDFFPDEPGRYDAILVFGGTMHTHEDELHPWLRNEKEYVREALERGVPVFGVCLGAQLLADAAGAEVKKLVVPEIGWYDVELTDDAADDPIFAHLPRRFASYQWHNYTFDLPPRAVALARNETCLQAFRLDGSWAVQFHPEVEARVLETWISNYDTNEDAQRLGRDTASGIEEARAKIGDWNEIGRTLARRFLDSVERAAP
ncbi:MAG: type 1 glutamine amidotransferase [Actinobacteria bacterium]|nr:type 1 glutamine amidotransferase [Actinomycetota bacterium]